MAKNQSKNDDKKPKKNSHDLTSIEDLGEFQHEENTNINQKFREFNRLPDLPTEKIQEESFHFENEYQNESEENPIESTSFEFNANIGSEEEVPEVEVELEPSEEVVFQDFIAEENTEADDVEVVSNEIESAQTEEMQAHFTEEIAEEFNDEMISEIQSENTYLMGHGSNDHFDVVANPAFSLMINDVDMEKEQDIIDILDEYGLLKMNQEKDYRMAIQNGNILISQLSEFLAIHLAIKLNRYGGVVKLGPSDLIYSSRAAGPSDSRGKITKRIKEQKKKGSHHFDQTNQHKDLEDGIHIFLNNDLGPTYTLLSKISPIFSSAILEEDELERSTYARTALKTENIPDKDIPLFIRYSEYLDLVKIELAEKLKEKARDVGANAISGINFQINTQTNKGKTLIILSAQAEAINIGSVTAIEV